MNSLLRYLPNLLQMFNAGTTWPDVLGRRMRAQEQVDIPQQLINANICYSLRQRPRDLEEASQNPLCELRRLSSCKGNWRLRLVKELEQQREELVWLCGIKRQHEQPLKCI